MVNMKCMTNSSTDQSRIVPDILAPSTRPEGKTEVNEAVDKPPDKRLFIKCDPNGDPDEVEGNLTHSLVNTSF